MDSKYPRVIVQRWGERDIYPTQCKTCERTLGVHCGIVACPLCGEIYLSRLRDARIGALLTEAFPDLRIVSGPRWPGYVQPRPHEARRALPRAVPDTPTTDDYVEILTLWEPGECPDTD